MHVPPLQPSCTLGKAHRNEVGAYVCLAYVRFHTYKVATEQIPYCPLQISVPSGAN